MAGSQLTDRVAALEAEKEALAATTKPPAKGGAKAVAPVDGADPVAAQLRFDLAEALRSKGSLQTRAKKAEDELVDLRNKAKTDTHELRALTSEKAALVTKLRDREHEIKEKRKLIEVCACDTSFPPPCPSLTANCRRMSKTR